MKTIKKINLSILGLIALVSLPSKVNAQQRVGDPGVTFDTSKYDPRYPQMKEWEKAGASEGIPFIKDLQKVETINSGANSATINSKIAAAASSASKSNPVYILLKNGTYTINSRIVMKSNVSLVGESRTGVKCFISMTNGDAFSFYKVKNCGIYDLTIEGSWGTPKYPWNYSLNQNDELPSNDNISVKFNDSEDCWLDRVNIINSAKDPVRCPANHITLRDLKVDGAHKKAGGAQGYFFIQGAYNLITGCEVTHIRHISLQGSNVEYNVVYDNDFKQEVSFHSGDNGNNLIEFNRITLPADMPNSKADTPNAPYNNSSEPNYYAIMGPWSIQHQNSKNPNFIFRNNCKEENHNNATPWSNPNLLYKGPRQVKPADHATNFPALAASLTPSGRTLYPVVLTTSSNGSGNNCNSKEIITVIEDAYLQGTTRFNTGDLRIENGKRISYLKFVVPTIPGNITSAKLVLNVSTDSGNGLIEIFKGSSNTWTENNLSTSNKPNEGTKIGSLNTNYNIGQSYEWLLSGIHSGEIIILIVKQIGGNDVSFSSKEGSNQPKLLLDVVCSSTNKNSYEASTSNSNSVNLTMYPNPAKDDVTVSGLEVGDEISIHDLQGKTIQDLKVISTEQTLSISSLKAGMYILVVKGKKQLKLVIE
ncbi:MULTISPECIES: T9SS type A sorting domain-containing protein [Flavobacterium]|uniref:T9SS type A sorting domain-containing protein n=1 Tax=Flavobacterium jumunjinense TaxID=998845 RepID=A0ABV5GJJ4_9FLAO|nr:MULTISPECIES: T9SS type A sorting domain-containing protein [Flavobacterium]